MGNNTKEVVQMIDNMIRLHFPYEEMYDYIIVCFPNLEMSFDEMLDLVEKRIIEIYSV